MTHDLRFALRMISSHRWFSAAVVATLALGIGLNTMIFTLVNAALFKPVPLPGGERLVAIGNQKLAQNSDGIGTSYNDFLEYRKQSSSFEAVEAATGEQAIVSEQGNPPQAFDMNRVSSGIFDMLRIRPTLGRGFLPADDKPGAEPVVLLGYGVWKDRYSSSRSVLGHQVRVNEKPATIIGVMPAEFKFPNNAELWMPLVPTPELENRSNRWVQVFGILKPGVSIPQATADLETIARRLAIAYPLENKGISAIVQTFHERYNGGQIRMVFLLMLAAVGFVLLIACANVANMMLSNALGRQREISIRAAMGATRWRVIRQLLIESMLLSTLGGVLGLGLAALGVHWFDLSSRDVGKPYWVLFTMNYTVFAYFAAICILCGLLFGLAPALRASRVDLNSALKDGGQSAGTHRGGALSGILVVFQFALTLVLLTAAGVFMHSFLEHLSLNTMVPAQQILTARLDLPKLRYADTDTRWHFYQQLQQRINALPGVTQAAIGSNLPGIGAATDHIEIEHSPIEKPEKGPSAAFLVQSPGYFSAINLPILSGRDFNDTDGSPNHEAAIVTAEFAQRYWPNQDAIGKRFRFYTKDKPDPWSTVIGVSANITQQPNEKNPSPLLFLPYRQKGWTGMALLVRSTGDSSAAVRAAVQNLDQDLPLTQVRMLSKAIEHDQWYLQLFGKLFLGFAIIALVMASVGIYAVIAQATSRRTQEIGVRIALGATTRNILGLVMMRGLKQLLIGLAIGLAITIPAARAMAALRLRASTYDPLVLCIVSLLLAAVGLFACWLPARRAAALDPVKAIRYE